MKSGRISEITKFLHMQANKLALVLDTFDRQALSRSLQCHLLFNGTCEIQEIGISIGRK